MRALNKKQGLDLWSDKVEFRTSGIWSGSLPMYPRVALWESSCIAVWGDLIYQSVPSFRTIHLHTRFGSCLLTKKDDGSKKQKQHPATPCPIPVDQSIQSARILLRHSMQLRQRYHSSFQVSVQCPLMLPSSRLTVEPPPPRFLTLAPRRQSSKFLSHGFFCLSLEFTCYNSKILIHSSGTILKLSASVWAFKSLH